MAATPLVLPFKERLAQGIRLVFPMAKSARNCIILMFFCVVFPSEGLACGVAAGGWVAEESCSQGPHCHGNIPKGLRKASPQLSPNATFPVRSCFLLPFLLFHKPQGFCWLILEITVIMPFPCSRLVSG